MLIAFVGTLVYYIYVFPTEGFRWPYIFAIAGISALSIFAFQAVDVYQVHAFRRPLNQVARMISAWSVVFLLAIAVSFFFKLDLALSRVWLRQFLGRSAWSCCSPRAPDCICWSSAGCMTAGSPAAPSSSAAGCRVKR